MTDAVTPGQMGSAHHAASKIAQLLADVVIHASPITSETSETVREAHREQWLEALEKHSAKMVGPLLQQLHDMPGTPPEVQAILKEGIEPSAQLSAFVSQFLVFGLAFSIGQTALAPFLAVMLQGVWAAHQDQVLSLADVANLAVRGFKIGQAPVTSVDQSLYDEAAKTGWDKAHVDAYINTVGMPPDMTSLFEMVRRGIITQDQLVQGIKESDVRDDWIPQLQKMAYVTPTPLDMVRAAVQAQLPYDPTTSTGEAKDLAIQLGLEPENWVNGNPDWFKILYDIAGRPPGPVEMGRAANRGIIPWEGTGPEALTFQQAIAESDVKTKWTEVLRQLAVYWPPPGEVEALLIAGGLTQEQAQAYWTADGIPAELAKAYMHRATIQQVTTDKALAKGDILELVQERVIDTDTAVTMLGQIGYDPDAATFLVNMAEWRWSLEALRRSVEYITRLYTTHKMSATETQNALLGLGISQAQVTDLMSSLSIQREVETPWLTASQVASALYYEAITPADAMKALEQLGYKPYDAWLLLSVRMHTPLPDQPPPSESNFVGLSGLTSVPPPPPAAPPGAGGQ